MICEYMGLKQFEIKKNGSKVHYIHLIKEPITNVASGIFKVHLA
jgi:hypothetical protein